MLLADAPWWGNLLLTLVVVVSWFVLRLTRLLMPTRSADRLAWWLALFSRRTTHPDVREPDPATDTAPGSPDRHQPVGRASTEP